MERALNRNKYLANRLICREVILNRLSEKSEIIEEKTEKLLINTEENNMP